MNINDKVSVETIIAQLVERQYHVPLTPSTIWSNTLQQQIEQLHSYRHDTAGLTLIAALHLLNDDLDLSHSYAQQIEHDRTGAYWHGIMHRMEGDYPNAKYWFRQAMPHPISDKVARLVAQSLLHTDFAEWTFIEDNSQVKQILLQFKAGHFSSALLTDLVQQSSNAIASVPKWTLLLQQIQAIELEQLFLHTKLAVHV
ncbi:hypothetical protein ACFSTH_02935 [Paenibacillus yanchengensis]|uniref:Uncharacterized protein n=1 Tax=Paenibacillus yanchengensis TaxID=2035833 RepID=A0ABW4YGC9_9BACL